MNFWDYVEQGFRDGWNPENPIGLNPETRQQLQDQGFFRKRGKIRPFGLFNEIVMGSTGALADLAFKSGGAVYGGGTGALAGLADKAGLHRPEKLYTDLMAMPEAFAGTAAGGIGGRAVRGRATADLRSAERTSRQFRPDANGDIDLGHIGIEVEKNSKGKFPQAPIRMRHGVPGPEGYGAEHISPNKHRRAQGLGYGDGLELIEDVAKNHDVVVEQVNGRLMLVKRDGQNRYAIAEYKNGGWRRLIGAGDPHYGVTTGYPDGLGQAKRGKTALKRALDQGGKRLK